MTIATREKYKVMIIENGEHKFYGEWEDKNIAVRKALELWFNSNTQAYVVENEE